MKAFYAVVIASLLLLIAARPQAQVSHSQNPYFNGPVKRVQQRVYGLDRHKVGDFYIPSGIPFSYQLPRIGNKKMPVQNLLLEAFDMDFDRDGKTQIHSRYDGEGNELELQVKIVWDNLGQYEQIKRKIHQDYSISYDSVVRHYDPESHILTRYHWEKKPDSSWRALPLRGDSILQIGETQIIFFERQKVLRQEVLSELPKGIKRQLYIVQNPNDESSIDSIIYSYKGNQVFSYSAFTANIDFQISYDSLGRTLNLISVSQNDRDSSLNIFSYDYDSNPVIFFSENIYKSFVGAKQKIEHYKGKEVFDNKGNISYCEYFKIEAGKNIPTYSNRFIYAPDSSSIRRDFFIGGDTLERYEKYTYDEFSNPIGYQNQIFYPEKSKNQSTTTKLDSLVYDQYGNWIEAIYFFNKEPYYRLERVFTYY